MSDRPKRPMHSPKSYEEGARRYNEISPLIPPDHFYPPVPSTNSVDQAKGTLPAAAGVPAPHAAHPDDKRVPGRTADPGL